MHNRAQVRVCASVCVSLGVRSDWPGWTGWQATFAQSVFAKWIGTSPSVDSPSLFRSVGQAVHCTPSVVNCCSPPVRAKTGQPTAGTGSHPRFSTLAANAFLCMTPQGVNLQFAAWAMRCNAGATRCKSVALKGATCAGAAPCMASRRRTPARQVTHLEPGHPWQLPIFKVSPCRWCLARHFGWPLHWLLPVCNWR